MGHLLSKAGSKGKTHPREGGSRRQRRPAWLRLILIGLALAALAGAWHYTPLREYVTADRITAWARAARATPWAPWLLVLAYTPAAFVMFPRPLLTLIAIIAFGTWLGFAYATAGVLLAAMVTFYLGRLLHEERVRKIAGDQLDPVGKVMREHGIVSIFALNMVPVPPFVVQGIIAGAVRMKAWQFAIGNLLGMLPILAAWTVLGAQISAALEDFANVSWWMIGAVLAVLVAITFFTRRWFARQMAPA
jgi:phospholipase D1/2